MSDRNVTGWLCCTLALGPILLLLPAVAWMAARLAFQRARRVDPQQRQSNRCRACGYDLRATPERCPECGAAASPSE